MEGMEEVIGVNFGDDFIINKDKIYLVKFVGKLVIGLKFLWVIMKFIKEFLVIMGLNIDNDKVNNDNNKSIISFVKLSFDFDIKKMIIIGM